MKLGEKLRYLRLMEGNLRGIGREMTQQEVVRAIRKDIGEAISQSYLSQIENGSRPHLTNSTRLLLAHFFKVHPGYLVDDPEGFSNELISDVGVGEDRMDLWLINGAERFRRDPEVSHALLEVARHGNLVKRSANDRNRLPERRNRPHRFNHQNLITVPLSCHHEHTRIERCVPN